MSTPTLRTILVAAAITTLAVAGCASANLATPTPTTTASVPPGSPPPDASAGPDAAFEALVEESIAFRREFGLRSDEAWVRQVAADPSARWSYQVPLTAAEEANLDARAAAVEDLGPILQDYGARHPDEFAGVYVDQERGGVLVVLFTGHLQEHGEAIAQLIRPGAAIELRQAPVSETDLNALMERVSGDEELRDLGVFVLEASADETRGIVEIGVSTERADVQGLVTGRYGPSVLVNVLDPTGAFLKPRGTIIGRVVDAAGNGVQGAVGGEPLFGDIPMDAVGPPETNPDGTFRLENQLPGRWRLAAFAEGFAETSVEVDVPPGGIVTVEIVLQPS
jgi:hypothetical protein